MPGSVHRAITLTPSSPPPPPPPPPSLGGSVSRMITLTPPQPSIVSISGSVAGSTITVATSGAYDLTTNAPTLMYGGLACTGIVVTGPSTFTAVMPAAGLALGSSNNFVLTVLGVQSAPAARTFNPALGQFSTLTVAYAAFVPDHWARDDEVSAVTSGLVVGDQVEVALKTNPTTSTPAGYDVSVNSQGVIWLTDPVGSTGNLAAETQQLSVNVALIDASTGYSRDTTNVVLSLNMPAGTLTLGTPVVTSTVATLPFTWTGTNASGFEYQIGSGAIIAISASPIGLSGLTPATAYTYRVRAVNGSWPGAWVSSSFTTAAGVDLTPNAFNFTPVAGANINTRVWSNWQPVTSIIAGQDVALSVAGDSPQWQYSTDGGATASTATTSAGNVRLNDLVRVSVLTSSAYSTAQADELALATVTCGVIESYFQVQTRVFIDDSPAITGPGALTVTLPPDQSVLISSHPDVVAWMDQWSAMDSDGNVLALSSNVQPSMQIYNSPITVVFTATDSLGRTQTHASQIYIEQMSDVYAPSLFSAGRTERFEQHGSRYYHVDKK